MERPVRAPRAPAFTVVELMIVIGIIGVLLAVALPAYTRLAARGHQTQCCSNLRQIFIALQNYAAANNGLLPTNLPGGEDHIPWPAGLGAPTAMYADPTSNEVGDFGRTFAARQAHPARVPIGLGKLHAELGENLAVLFCPADGRRNPGATRNAFMTDQLLTTGDTPNCSYLYRGRCAPDVVDTVGIRHFGYDRDSPRALVMDYYYVGMSQANHIDRICILFEDGRTFAPLIKNRFVDPRIGQAALIPIWRHADRIYSPDD